MKRFCTIYMGLSIYSISDKRGRVTHYEIRQTVSCSDDFPFFDSRHDSIKDAQECIDNYRESQFT